MDVRRALQRDAGCVDALFAELAPWPASTHGLMRWWPRPTGWCTTVWKTSTWPAP
jgi:hypothetical protein